MNEPEPPPPPWEDKLKPPHAVIQKAGRWTYRIYIDHGLTIYAPGGYGWHRLGRERAERKARRELARYNRDRQRRAEKWEIHE